MGRKPKELNAISSKPNNKMNNDHVARLRVVQEVSSRNSSASWNSSCTFSTEQSLQDQPRPPVYNVEDYAGALRRFGKRGPTADGNNGGGGSSETKHTEMTLKEFTSATELLDKLKADLKLAYFSFVQEFVGDPIDGVTLLLELLKSVQQNGTQTKCTPANQRRAALDENSCLQCLKYCLRCQDAARKLAISPAGLYTLAACIMSTVNHSRLLTLELLTKACCESGTADGHNTVSDAMSTMRLRFAEPVRFRFLIGMMSGTGGSGMELLLAGLKFINAFTETCPDLQTKFYVQAELKQAGFKPAAILKNISNKSPLLSSVSDEIYRWQKNFINVESLKRQHDEVVREAKSLRDKVIMLEKKIHLLQEEKRAMICSRADGPLQKGKNEGGGNSAEDEGISSSEQDDCDEDAVSSKKTAKTPPYKMSYNGHQQQQQRGNESSTVEEVLDDFDKVINDASCAGSATIAAAQRIMTPSTASSNGHRDSSDGGGGGPKRYCREFSEADDAIIVPARIVPEPPRRSRSLFVNKNFEVNPFFEDDEEEDSDLGAYEDDDDGDDDDDDADEDAAKRRADDDDDGGGGTMGKTAFRSVQNQIKRFSALALRGGADDGRRHDRAAAVCRDGHDGRRKSIYDVFGKPTASVCGNGFGRPVVRSASTRNVGETAASRIPVMKSERSVYLPTAACGADQKEPKVQFVARVHSGMSNNAGLYSGYEKDCRPSANGLKALRHLTNMSVSTGKLTDFPSGLY